MKSTITRFALVAVLFFCSSAQIFAQEGNDNGMMNAWMEMIAPGEEHEFLSKMEGKWTFTNTWWMQPGAEPMTSQGKCTRKMIMGGRYLMDETSGTSFGMPMEGLQLLGFDKASGKFVASWIDNMGTGIMNSEGGWKEEGKSIEMMNDYYDPMSKMNFKIRQVTRIVDKDNMVFEYYQAPEGGEEFLSMKIEYKRTK